MKADKIPVLLTLFALMGTFTATMPQAFADIDPDDFCLDTDIQANPANDDDHNLGVDINSGDDPFVVQLQSMYSLDGPDTPDSSLVKFNIHKNTGTLDSPVKGAFVGLIESTDETISDPKDFTGTFSENTFPGLTEDNFVGFACGKETENPSTPMPTPGVHHSDTLTFRIDRTAPTFDEPGCQDLRFQAEEEDGETIPRTDSRFDSFFDVAISDNLDDNPTLTDDAPDNIPVGETVEVEFTASDDGDIPTEDDNNESTDTCEIFITPIERPGCEFRTLDQSGNDVTIEICLEVVTEEAICELAILGTETSLEYGTLSQGDTSDFQSLFLANLGNAPFQLKVVATHWLDDADGKIMDAEQTHFSTVDPDGADPEDFYDGEFSFEVSQDVLTIIEQIFEPGSMETFWQLRINLLESLFFGDLHQTMTLKVQECSTSNECEILGDDCPKTGDTLEIPDNGPV